MFNSDYLLMSAGPTMVRKNVLDARAKFFGNPDLDENFFEFYNNLCKKIGSIINAKHSKVVVMSGEGMVGLDAACASLTEPGDEVLVIGNGIFGNGFTGLITPYGGKVTLFEGDWQNPISPLELEKFIVQSKKKFKYATVVHCDTPSGMLNDVKSICSVLKKHNILSVVDSVAAMGGTPLDVDGWSIDIALGGSQKVFSTPPGLTILTVSQMAFDVMKSRKYPIVSYYCNLLLWESCYENRYFPYTMPASDLMGLDVAIDNLLEFGIGETIAEHEKVASFTRNKLKDFGLTNFLESGFSPTVTAFLVPEGYYADKICAHMLNKYRVMIAGSYGDLKGKVLRIGHMGENIFEGRVDYTLDCLKKTLEDLR